MICLALDDSRPGSVDNQRPLALAGRALVTGATGFTGGYLMRALHRHGVHVRALVRNPGKTQFPAESDVEVAEGDLTDPRQVERAVAGCDFVFHLAAVHRDAKYSDPFYRSVNVDGTGNLVRAAARQGVTRFIHCSTAALHNGPILPADESAPLLPQDIYEATKLAAEDLVREQFARGLAGTIVRPVGIYGPGEMRFLKLFRAIKNGTFRMIGSGNTLQHLTYVDDVVDGILLCVRQPQAVGETYIMAGPRFTTVDELVRATARAIGCAAPRGHVPLLPVLLAARLTEVLCRPFGIEPPLHPRRVAFFTRNRGYSSDKARRELGYSPKVDLDEGLARMARWYCAIGAL